MMDACVCVLERERERGVEGQTNMRQTRWENDWGEGRQADKGRSESVSEMYSGSVIEAMC